jgi:hypothetical protein
MLPQDVVPPDAGWMVTEVSITSDLRSIRRWIFIPVTEVVHSKKRISSSAKQ